MDPERQKTLSLILLINGFYFMNNFFEKKETKKTSIELGQGMV